MKTLVYIASGGYRKEYESLDYDRVYLVDTALRNRVRSDKVKLLRCDALEAVEYFKKEGIVIDCLVCLCESVGEGGQTYAVCSDVFMGYVMPVLANDFLWICNDIQYYPGLYRSTKGQRFDLPGSGIRENPYGMHLRYGFNHVSLDLPYSMQELTDGDPEYIPPSMFSRLLSEHNGGHVYRMRYSPSIETFVLSPGISIRLIQDSIWNHYDELDHLFVSFKGKGELLQADGVPLVPAKGKGVRIRPCRILPTLLVPVRQKLPERVGGFYQGARPAHDDRLLLSQFQVSHNAYQEGRQDPSPRNPGRRPSKITTAPCPYQRMP